MKNTLWLYKNPYQIEIRENEAHPPQVAVYLYEAEEEIKNVVLTGGGSVSSLWEKSVLLDGDRLLIACGKDIFVSPIERTPAFKMTPQGIDLVDFNYEEYHIDYEG